MKSRTCIVAVAVFAALTNAWAQGQESAHDGDQDHKFQVSSTTFSNGAKTYHAVRRRQCCARARAKNKTQNGY
jgi:hypothetical protein